MTLMASRALAVYVSPGPSLTALAKSPLGAESSRPQGNAAPTVKGYLARALNHCSIQKNELLRRRLTAILCLFWRLRGRS
jgi:hypothetical protein